MVLYVGQGDAEPSMRLLWRTGAEAPRTRGPKPKLSVEEIVDAAVALADEGGIDALSMRAVGDRLGRTPMAIYTYVPGKAELLDLMWDRVLAELPAAYDASAGWRAALVEWAEANWALCQRHPWFLSLSGARPTLGPHETRNAEAAVAVLEQTALSARDRARSVWALSRYVHGSAKAFIETVQATEATGVAEDTWWFARAALLEEVAPDYAERFPALTRIAASGGFDQPPDATSYLEAEARDTFEFGLARLLDGLAALVESAD